MINTLDQFVESVNDVQYLHYPNLQESRIERNSPNKLLREEISELVPVSIELS